jgi:threonine synthase
VNGISYSPDEKDANLPGIWRYANCFSLPNGSPVVSLGEGNTPLIWSELFGKGIAFKLESQNPTGSFKDRGTAVLVSWLKAIGISEAVEDSSGNAGASFAAYAARAGIKARIYVPASATGPKRKQIESYGAEVVPIPGVRSKAADAVIADLKKGSIYASHAYLPHGTAGIATIAFELIHQMEEVPGTILLPVGHGSLLMGLFLGFQALVRAGKSPHIPVLVGIQAALCAPLFSAYTKGLEDPDPISEGITMAGGVQISKPYHGKAILKAVRESGGQFLAVHDEVIVDGQTNLARLGIHVELTSALVWDGLEQIHDQTPEPIVCIISGHGLKSG